jgi:hypothetical protein
LRSKEGIEMADPKRPQVTDKELIDAIWRQATTATMSDDDWLDTAPAEDDADEDDEDEDDEDEDDEVDEDEDDDEDDDEDEDDAADDAK